MAVQTGPVARIRGREEVRETVGIFERTRFLFFKVTTTEVVRTEHIGNDLFVQTDRPLRRVLINNVEYVEKA